MLPTGGQHGQQAVPAGKGGAGRALGTHPWEVLGWGGWEQPGEEWVQETPSSPPSLAAWGEQLWASTPMCLEAPWESPHCTHPPPPGTSGSAGHASSCWRQGDLAHACLRGSSRGVWGGCPWFPLGASSKARGCVGRGLHPVTCLGWGSHGREVLLGLWRSGVQAAPQLAPHSPSGCKGAAMQVLTLHPTGLGGVQCSQGGGQPLSPQGSVGPGGLQPLSQWGPTCCGRGLSWGVPTAIVVGRPLSPHPSRHCWAVARRPASPGLSGFGKRERTRQTSPLSTPGRRRAPHIPPTLLQVWPTVVLGTLPWTSSPGTQGATQHPAADPGLDGHGVARSWLGQHHPALLRAVSCLHTGCQGPATLLPVQGHASGTWQGGLGSPAQPCWLVQHGGEQGSESAALAQCSTASSACKIPPAACLDLGTAPWPVCGTAASSVGTSHPALLCSVPSGRVQHGMPGPAWTIWETPGVLVRGIPKPCCPKAGGEPLLGPQHWGSSAPRVLGGLPQLRQHVQLWAQGVCLDQLCSTRLCITPWQHLPPQVGLGASCSPAKCVRAWRGQPASGMWLCPCHAQPGIGLCLPAGLHAAGVARHCGLHSWPRTGRFLFLP